MPRRNIWFSTGEYYHIYNRSLYKGECFHTPRDYEIFIRAMGYYLLVDPPGKFSRHIKISNDSIQLWSEHSLLASIHAFAVMPNHFHILVQQSVENGISIYMSRFMNSYVHYYNKKYTNNGPLFNGQFKAKHISSREELLHISRYIHLNPTTSFITKDPIKYPYSSFKVYCNDGKSYYPWIDRDPILNEFIKPRTYQEFVNNNIDYQRSLKQIEHLVQGMS